MHIDTQSNSSGILGGPASAPNGVDGNSRVFNRQWYIMLLVSLVLIAIAHLLDAWTWAHVRDAKVYERDWGRMLRSVGYLPTWIVVAIALYLTDRSPNANITGGMDAHESAAHGWKWRGSLMLLTPVLTGAMAELLKLLTRRLRPGALSPEYLFRPFSEGPWSNRGMGMPSSHVMVAVGAATILSRLFPRAWWLWYLLAAGCAYTRILAGAHYLSDTVVGAATAWLVADAVFRWSSTRKTA